MNFYYRLGHFIQSLIMVVILLILGISCTSETESEKTVTGKLIPVIITQPVKHDSDDPAIWVHPTDPTQSLVIGTDKDVDGALYVYDLEGQIIEDKVVRNLKRPNNVDVEYGLILNGNPVDIAVTTERYENRIRIFSVPDMTPVDNGGIPVFEGEIQKNPMGIAIYKRTSDGAIYAIVGRKEGPTTGSYLWQYLLEDDGSGSVKATKVRELGTWSGKKEIEAIAVDDKLGFIYYSDEGVGVRKYHADPDNKEASQELAQFCNQDIVQDQEGISIYEVDDSTGYILVSDQQANEFHIFKREGESDDPHNHLLVKVINVSTSESDGSDVTSVALNENFPQGLFVAMSDNKTFHYYSWVDIAGNDLKMANQ
jgi:3-phytase